VRYYWPVQFYNYGISYLNAEGTNFPAPPDTALYARVLLEPSARAVPQEFTLFVQSEYGNKYQVRADFDEAETRVAFQALLRLSPTSPITLFFTFDKPFQKATLTLKNEAKEILLTKSPVEVLSED
jgi:hypothetical protein